MKNKILHIYFSWSIREETVWSDLYVHIVEHLKQYGAVLTEHVAHAFKNPQRYNIAFNEKDIFEADTTFLNKADVLIAEVSAPSHGVGRELCYAGEVRNIPILALHLPEVNVSAMIKGNPKILLQEYTGLVSCKELIDSFLQKHSKKSWHKNKNIAIKE